jgi:hypothetical protein
LRTWIAVAFVAFWLVACSPTRTPPPMSNLVLSDDLLMYSTMWEREARTKLRDPFIVIVHGYTGKDGTWWCAPTKGPPLPVESLARTLKQIWPDRPVVLVCCNDGRLDLKVPGVWYAKDIVVSPPRYPTTRISRIEHFIESK